MKKNNTRGKVTERTCNIDGCGRVFDAIDDMRSCPVCTNTKNHGESFSAGLDEYNTGVIGGINK